MADGAARFRQDFSGPVLLRILLWYIHHFIYGTITPYGPAFQLCSITMYMSNIAVLQPLPCRNMIGLGFFPFARHYLGNHFCFLLLRLLRCFSSAGSPPSFNGSLAFNQRGFPIRISPDYRLFAATRSFSQLITSFFASESLGIPHTPLFTFFHK